MKRTSDAMIGLSDDEIDPPFNPKQPHNTIPISQHYKRPRVMYVPPPAPPISSSSSSSASAPAKPALLLPPEPVKDHKMEDLRKEYECAVCQETLFNPYHCSAAKSHNICKVCLDSLPSAQKPCPTCRNTGPWYPSHLAQKTVEIMFPEDYKRREDLDWLHMPFPEIVPELKRRFDPEFKVLATEGNYGWTVKYMIQVLKEETEEKKKPKAERKAVPQNRTDRFHKLVTQFRPASQPHHRHFSVMIGFMSCCDKGHSNQGGAANHNLPFSKHFATDVFAVQLKGTVWMILDAPEILDDEIL